MVFHSFLSSAMYCHVLLVSITTLEILHVMNICTSLNYMEHQYTTQVILHVINICTSLIWSVSKLLRWFIVCWLHLYGSICNFLIYIFANTQTYLSLICFSYTFLWTWCSYHWLTSVGLTHAGSSQLTNYDLVLSREEPILLFSHLLFFLAILFC